MHMHTNIVISVSMLQVIKVEDIDSSLLDNLELTLLHRSDKEDVMRTIFQTARHAAQKQISELLADFRQKRTLGELH